MIITNRLAYISTSEIIYFSFVWESEVTLGSTLRPLILNTFINYIINVINIPQYLLFVDDLKIIVVLIILTTVSIFSLIITLCRTGVSKIQFVMCSLVEADRCFNGSYCVHHRGDK